MIEDIKEKIKMAERTVEDVKDPNLKQKAFEVVLSQLLAENQTEKMQVETQESISTKRESYPDKINILLKTAGMTHNDFYGVVDIEDDGTFHIIQDIPGRSISMRQRNATVLILTLKNYLVEDKEIRTKELNNSLRDMGIGSLGNLSANLKGFENYLLFKGKRGSSNAVYRITNPGLNFGIELIKRMVSGDGR